VKAFGELAKKITIDKDDIEVLVLVTQNPDERIPHTSAIVHGKLDMPEKCACFDVSPRFCIWTIYNSIVYEGK